MLDIAICGFVFRWSKIVTRCTIQFFLLFPRLLKDLKLNCSNKHWNMSIQCSTVFVLLFEVLIIWGCLIVQRFLVICCFTGGGGYFENLTYNKGKFLLWIVKEVKRNVRNTFSPFSQRKWFVIRFVWNLQDFCSAENLAPLIDSAGDEESPIFRQDNSTWKWSKESKTILIEAIFVSL
jgi:hypothetical protein